MRYQVMGKQPNSKMCLVCGLKNRFGLRSFFYELDNEELLAIFRLMAEHQSYPGRLHGGIATAILDETIGRAIMMKYDEEIWGVTLEFTIRFKKPIPPPFFPTDRTNFMCNWHYGIFSPGDALWG